ncbi:MAG: winged helix DNA-binding domain-containing protein [Acidimicrobiales bacterium]
MHIDDDQRRARLARRHALTADDRVGGTLEAAEAVVALHATEPASVYLSAQARAEVTMEDVEAAIYRDRSVVRQLAMRRTVFAFPRRLLPAVWGSAAARVAAQQRAQLARDLLRHGDLDADPAGAAAWVDDATGAAFRYLADHGPTTTMDLRAALPRLDTRITRSPGTRYGGTFPVAPNVMTVLAAGGTVVRGTNDGNWRTSRPRWTTTADWLGEPARPTTPEEGYRILVEAWLRRFGPGTEDDLVWWLGATKGAVRQAIRSLDVVTVTVDAHPHDRGPGPDGLVRDALLMADDTDPVDPPEPWAALLPVLDPTTMGWKHRGFYLGPHRDRLFDRNGNAGSTAWWNGRIVGGWAQRPDGEVVVLPIGDVGAEAEAALEREAERLTTFLAGDVVGSVYHSPLVRAWTADQEEP